MGFGMDVIDSFKIEDKVCIVTGVSSGLGVAFATALAEAGANVVVCARRREKLELNAKRISEQTGKKIIPITADVSKENDIANVVSETEREFGKIDILVNNAGIGSPKPSVDTTEKEWSDVITVNLTGAFLFSRDVAKSMIKNKVDGSIVNIVSIYGLSGDTIPSPAYYASKGALVNLTKALANEWAPYGIRVNAIAPGFFPSEMTASLQQDQNMMNYVKNRTPLGRMGNPDELKPALVLLASNAGSYITGHTLCVDGGWNSR